MTYEISKLLENAFPGLPGFNPPNPNKTIMEAAAEWPGLRVAQQTQPQKQGPELDAEAKALAILAQQPELTSVAAVAKLVGCSRQYLANSTKCPRFACAWETLLRARLDVRSAARRQPKLRPHHRGPKRANSQPG